MYSTSHGKVSGFFPFRSVAVSFLFRFLAFPFSELRIMSALAFKVLSRASDRSRWCSLTSRSKGSWLCVARHDENRTGPVNRSRTGRLRVCVARTASYVASALAYTIYWSYAACSSIFRPFWSHFLSVFYPFLLYRFFTVPFRSRFRSFPFPFRLNGTEQNAMTYTVHVYSQRATKA